MLTNDEPKGKLLFITDAKQNKNNKLWELHMLAT
jgi:hypothetical protein